FVRDALSALHAVEMAVFCVDAGGGVKVNTRLLWAKMVDHALPRIIVVTRHDSENVSFDEILEEIREAFGDRCIPLNVPDADGPDFKAVQSTLSLKDGASDRAKALHEQILEAIVESDDAVLERYFNGEKIPDEDISRTFRKALLGGTLTPILFAAAEKEIGVEEVLDAIVDYGPSPADRPVRVIQKEGEDPTDVQEDGPFTAFVFKLVSDEHVGKLCFFRIFSGSIKPGDSFKIARTGKSARTGQIYRVQGTHQEAMEIAEAGQIVAVAKIDELALSDTLRAPPVDWVFPAIEYPIPMVAFSVHPKSRGDEQKISTALQKLAEEDRTFVFERDETTRELVIRGMSDLHLQILLRRMKRRFKVEVETRTPKIPYRETITKGIKYVEYTHKKQTGGAGQFARVYIDIEPTERGAGYEFKDKIVGGSIDQPLRGSVDKGIHAKLVEGVLAGYPVVDLKVTLVDGKTHPVDSKDIAFQIAGREVFKKAFMVAGPVLLEPIVDISITAPNSFMGDIISDLNGRRGRIVNTTANGGMQTIEGRVPLAEIMNYSTELKSKTGGEGTYSIAAAHYDAVPTHIQDKIVARARLAKEKGEG
ncbi:MAG: elongation factor G, partial [Planctomycetota bacterium]|nr:elongation factor G [Planctomycetota bacterium]